MATLRCIDLRLMQEVTPPQATVLCLGNFDGVHLAHRRLLRRARQLCQTKYSTAAPAVFCFCEPSADTLLPSPPPHLTTLPQKLERFRDEGMDYALLTDFPSIRDLSPEAFVTELLCRACGCVAAVCGFNYRFGKGGRGTPVMMREVLGLPVFVEEEVLLDGDTVSSTRIRRLLLAGDAERAATLLTRPYEITAPVLHGKALGKHLGAPTLNQGFPHRMLIPAYGVYATECIVDGQILRGVTNVGVHPTVDREAEVNCETYLLDFSGDLYGREVTVRFLRFLRPEQKFETQEALQRQIACDIAAVRALPER